MAAPFDLPGPTDSKKSKRYGDSKNYADDKGQQSRPHCRACTDFKTWMQLTGKPSRVS